MALLLAACNESLEPRSGHGLRLPDGDAERGRAVFERLGCRECHDLASDPRPGAPADRERFLTLGGVVTRVETHGELVTAIVNPMHEISRPLSERSPPRMRNWNDQMTVEELIDLVAFVQAQYERRPQPDFVR